MKYLKYGLAVAAGIFIGYTIAYNYFDKQYEEEFDKTLNEMVDIVKKDTEEIVSNSEKDNNDKDVVDVDVDDKILKDELDDPDIFEVSYEDYFNIPEREGNHVKYPYKDSDKYERDELFYYDEDGILTDIDGELDDKTKYKYVSNVLDNPSISNDDVEVVYVRNKKLMKQWEVDIVHGSYQEEILGMYKEE